MNIESDVEVNDDTEIKGIRWGRLKFKLEDKSFNTVEFAVSYISGQLEIRINFPLSRLDLTKCNLNYCKDLPRCKTSAVTCSH